MIQIRIGLIIFVYFFFGQAAWAENLDLETLTSVSMNKLRIQANIHDKTWGITRAINSNLDQNTGKIYWNFPNDLTVEAPVQIIGTYNPNDQTFLWSWGNHTVLSALHVSASLVRSYGEENEIESFKSRLIQISEEQAWEVTAIANHLAKSNGGYRADVGGLVVYVTFGKVRLQ